MISSSCISGGCFDGHILSKKIHSANLRKKTRRPPESLRFL
ncbi:hypothetical protein EVA_12384 [gut metagenome]|uniref:Uncharacterized protein n=1 Tax=gut metagenome TaxID=749906 RepID=J9GIX6_9ZZZZ